MHMVVQPRRLSLEEWHACFDRLYCRIWSWRRFFRGKAGDCSFLAFGKWWVFVRAIMWLLRWRRRKLYRDRDAFPAAPAAPAAPAMAADVRCGPQLTAAGATPRFERD